MSDEPEVEEYRIEAAEARRAGLMGALLLGAVLPGMDVATEDKRGAAEPGVVAAAEPALAVGERWRVRDGVVVADTRLHAFAALFRA